MANPVGYWVVSTIRWPVWHAAVYCRSRLEGRLSVEVTKDLSSAVFAGSAARASAAAISLDPIVKSPGSILREEINIPDAVGDAPQSA
jgi:hypothetical protein